MKTDVRVLFYSIFRCDVLFYLYDPLCRLWNLYLMH